MSTVFDKSDLTDKALLSCDGRTLECQSRDMTVKILPIISTRRNYVEVLFNIKSIIFNSKIYSSMSTKTIKKLILG